ncbi:MAG: hypothetical protein Q8930_00695, partial [Bacillota bacterium]|nr:hypothetical protein [Bacillota bacterium]
FCINSERNELFHHMVGRSRISSVYLIQFCYIHYVFSMLRRRDYILIFSTNDFTYILFCLDATLHKSFLLENEVAKYSNISTKIESIFKDAAADTGIRKIPVVFINFEFKDIIEKLSYSYYVYDVGRIDEDKIIKKYIGVL